MNINEKISSSVLGMTIEEFIQSETRGSDLLQVLGIPVRGNEHKSLMEVCTLTQRNETEVVEKINQLKKGEAFNYPDGIINWSAELVIRYLEEEHHAYTRKLMQDAVDYGNRAWDVHGTQYPELNQVKWYVQKLNDKLEMLLKFEEQKFFPKILRFFEMNGASRDGTVQSLRKQAEIIEKDQKEIEYFIQRIRELTENFTPPKEACTTLRLLYFTLQNLGDDLQKHHFLEELQILSRLKEKLNNLLN